MSQPGTIALAKCLKVNTGLKQLRLAHDHSLKADGVRQIAESLTSNATLTSLTLWAVGMGNDGAVHLANSLKVNRPSWILTVGLCSSLFVPAVVPSG